MFEFCSGLVDLVVGVGRHGGGGHRLTLAGERFVGLLAEDVAEVGDGGGELGVRCRGEGTEGEASDGGRRFVASEPVEKSGEDGQRRAGAARSTIKTRRLGRSSSPLNPGIRRPLARPAVAKRRPLKHH